MKSIPMAFVAVAIAMLIVAAACTTEKTVYVLPDGTEVTPTAAQATQAAGGGSQAAAPQSAQPTPASESAPPAPSQAAPASTRASAPAPAVNPRWNDRRNTLCSSLGLDAGVCEKIALNQTGPDGETQDIDLPDEPYATPVPIDDVGDVVEELQEIVASEGEVSIQVLTYTESLISQAADAVVQAEQELANQEATAAYLDAKKQELQELRRTYAQLLERIGVAQDRSLALAEQIEQEHLAFSIERANGEALIRYKDARLAHTNALAEAERNAVAQIDTIASVNDAASQIVAERIDLAPLYKERDETQEAYDAAIKRFEGQIHQYEKNWLDVYEVYIADPAVRDANTDGYWLYGFPRYKTLTTLSSEKELLAYHCPLGGEYRDDGWNGSCFPHPDIDILTTGIVPPSKRERGEETEPTSQVLTLFRKELDAVEQEITRAIALNEKSQSVAELERAHTALIGTSVSAARLAVVDAYRKHGISEGRAGAIFMFTDSGEDAVTYNLSLAALNRDAAANLEAFQSNLNFILDTLDADIRSADDVRAEAIDAVEDARYARADTVDEEKQSRVDWHTSETLRSRIVLMDALMMSAGWSIIASPLEIRTGDSGVVHLPTWVELNRDDDTYTFPREYMEEGMVPGLHCPAIQLVTPVDNNSPYRRHYKTVTGIGRDEYIRQNWHKEQPLERTYTTERLKAVESVVNNLEQWLQDTADMWWDEYEKEYCDAALESFKAKKQEIIRENPLPMD